MRAIDSWPAREADHRRRPTTPPAMTIVNWGLARLRRAHAERLEGDRAEDRYAPGRPGAPSRTCTPSAQDVKERIDVGTADPLHLAEAQLRLQELQLKMSKADYELLLIRKQLGK
jgi:hypothetical protein